MLTSIFYKLFRKKVFNMARAVPRYRVSSSLESDRKGVSI